MTPEQIEELKERLKYYIENANGPLAIVIESYKAIETLQRKLLEVTRPKSGN